jgi:hypothetical protein
VQQPAQTQPTTETELSPQQKLAMLEERLLRGKIDQELFESLKVKYEMETKPYEPSPQLPPVQGPTTPTPAPTIAPETQNTSSLTPEASSLTQQQTLPPEPTTEQQEPKQQKLEPDP